MKQELFAFGVCLLSAVWAKSIGLSGSPVSAIHSGDLATRELRLPERAPERVVTAALYPEELLLDLLEPERWVGISRIVDWPGSSAVSSRFPKNSRRVSGSPEAILSLNPDLVIVSDYTLAATEVLLRSAGVPIWRVPTPRTLSELFEQWRRLGDLVHRSPRATELVSAAQARLEKLRGALPPLGALFIQGRFAYASGALQVDCPTQAGLQNLLSDDGRGPTPLLSEEELAVLTPDLVFLGAPVETARKLEPNEPLPELPPGAFLGKKPRVFLIPSSLMGSMSQLALDACELYVSLVQEEES